MSLTAQQRLFVHEYLVDLNGTQAAIRAGYSSRSAAQQASELLKNPKVAEAVQALQDARAKRTGITSDVVLGELLKLATCDVTDAFDETGKLLPLKQIPADVRRAIAAIDVEHLTDGGKVVRLRFHSKDRSLELLGKHLRLYTDRVEHSAVHGLADLLTRARARVKDR